MGWFPGWLGWLKRTDDHDFEKVFERLDASIQTRTEHLAEIRQREHRAIVLFTSWILGLWVLYVAVWWTGALSGSDALSKAVYALPLAIGPVLTIFTRRTFRWWYRRKQNIEDAELKVLRKKQQEQVEKFKKLTRFDETRQLLEKYDDKTRRSSLAGFPLQQLRGSPGRGSPFGTPRGSPTRGRGAYPNLAPAINAQMATPTRGFQTPGKDSPASRGFLDRFAEKILGDDETAPQNKYALICGKCFAHNGLVLKGELATTQYTCPKCGHFNPPKPASAMEEPSSAIPRSRTYSALSPVAQSAVFGRHAHRHSMVEFPNSPSTSSMLRPAHMPRRPSSAGEVEHPRGRMDEGEDEEDDEEGRPASEPAHSPPSHERLLPSLDMAMPGGSAETHDGDDVMDEG